MTTKPKNDLGEIVLYRTEDGKTTLDVRLAGETAWLTQAQMAKLFGRERSVITKHLGNVFPGAPALDKRDRTSKSLSRSRARRVDLLRRPGTPRGLRPRWLDASRSSAARDYAPRRPPPWRAAKEGELNEKSNVQNLHIAGSDRPVRFFNLDVVISVGYRVKSKRGTQFRIWATQTLKEHLNRGYILHRQWFEGKYHRFSHRTDVRAILFAEEEGHGQKPVYRDPGT